MIASLSVELPVWCYPLAYSTHTEVELGWGFGQGYRLRLTDTELHSLLHTQGAVYPWKGQHRYLTPFGFGLLADFITDHLDRLASVSSVYPVTDPVPVLLLWRDWCRTQFERSQQ